MTAYLASIAGLLLLTLLAGLARILLGPSPADRMLVSQLFGTAGVAVLILLGLVQEQPELFNAALVVALLAPLTLIVFVRLAGNKK